jgi:uncharacterized glyoxalase superfamily protein PhnB
MTITPYLFFEGRAEEAIGYYSMMYVARLSVTTSGRSRTVVD